MEQPKKLRVLCLHGFNTSVGIMRFQMVNFMLTFGDICEFTFIEGVMPCNSTPPIESFVKRGFVPPFRKWMFNKYLTVRKLSDGTIEPVFNKVTLNYSGALETMQFITDFINMQSEPFDGFIGFS